MWNAADLLRDGARYEQQRHIADADRARLARRLTGRGRTRRTAR
jgi:hypothetical protein